MTAVDDRTAAIARERAALDEDFFGDLLPEAAAMVVNFGHASTVMLGRKMRIGHHLATDLLVELHELGAVGPDHGDQPGTRDVLVDGPDGLADLLARIATLAGDDAAGEVVEVVAPAPPPVVVDMPPAVVDLVKPPPATTDRGEVAIRPDDDLEVWQPPARQVPMLVVRVRRARARLADEPAVIRTMAVSRQAPRAGMRLVVWTPRGAVRAARQGHNWLFASTAQAAVARMADEGHPDWPKAVEAVAKLQDQAATRRWLVGILAGLLVLACLAWWAPVVFAGVLAVVAFGVVLAAGMSVSHHPKDRAGVAVVAVALAGLAWWQGPALAALIPRPPVWVWWALAAVLVVVFGVLGRKEDQKLVNLPPTAASSKPPIITPTMAIAAVASLGHPKMKDPDSIRVMGDPHRSGPFVQVDLEFPQGATAAWVVENREPLAAALRRPMSMVWPRVGPAHPGHFNLLVSEIPMNEMDQTPWPLLAAAGPIDIFTPQPVFTDQLGDWKALTLAYGSWVIGAVPRMGKTYTVRELLLIFGMDLRVKVIGLDGKGTGDLSPLVPFLHLHVRGARVDKPEGIEKVRKLVLDLLHEMGRRADVLASLPFEEVPESKVTSELINAHPELDLGPIVVGMDETQAFFSYGFKANKEHKEIREEIRDGVIELMRMGPALGIWVILATQTVRDSTIPTEAQAVAVYRYGMKMESHEPNDKVLGTGAHRSGVTATIFGFEEKGIGWVKGEGAKPFIGRTVYGLDAVASRTLATRIRAWRQARNLLTGEAAGGLGIEDAEIVYDLAADAEHVMCMRGQEKAQWGDLLAWLREFRDQYAPMTEEELSAGVRAVVGRSRDVRSGPSVQKGVYLRDLRNRGGNDDGQ